MTGWIVGAVAAGLSAVYNGIVRPGLEAACHGGK